MFSFQEFVQSLRYAFSGLKYAFYEEQSFRIQLLTALFVTFLMFYFGITALEKTIILIMVFLVLSLELINTTAEKMLDIVEPEFRPQVRVVKDTMAAGVLVAALGALIIGLIIFLPYF